MTTDDFFSGRRVNPIVRKYVFSDRASERRAILGRSLSASRRSREANLADFARPASNLTAIWGTGGVGKSALLNEVRRAFTEDVNEETAAIALNVDLSDYSNHDFETILIQIRAAVARLDKSWPAFDLTFTNYWAKKHPGVDMMRFISNAGFLSSDQREAVVDQLSAILEVVLGGVGIIGSTYRLLSSLRQELSDSLAAKRLMANCPPFKVLMNEPDLDRVLGYLPSLLAYDLHTVHGKADVAVLCTLDTLEYIQVDGRDRGQIEDLLSRLVYLMPNVAFLAASRTRLDWADDTSRTSLTYGGPERWPELVEGQDGSIRLTGLADSYANQLLQDSLELGGRPAIPVNLRQQIVHGSAGLPLHLELSMSWFRDTAAAGGTSDLSGTIARSFPELVVRIMRDLSAVERDLLRGAALLEAFDVKLLSIVVPEARQSEINDFLERPMIERTPLGWLPYSLHDSLRAAIIDQDRHTERHWTKSEWTEKALLATGWLADQILPIWENPDTVRVLETEGRHVASAFLLTLNAAQRHQILPRSLGEIAFLVYQLGYSRVFDSSSDAIAWQGSEVLSRLVAAARIHSGIALSDYRKYELLKPLVTFDAGNRYDQFVASVFAIYADVKGEYEDAQRAFSSIQDAPSYMHNYGSLGLAGSLLRSGRLRSALQRIDSRSGHPLDKAHRFDLLGHIYLQGGEHTRAEEAFRNALSEAQISGSPLWVARSLRHVVNALAWVDPNRSLELVREATEINASLDDVTGLAQIEMSAALAWAWMGEWERSEQMLLACKSHGLDPVAIGHPAMIEILIALGQGDDHRARTVSNEALQDTRARRSPGNRPHVWLAVIALWAGRDDTFTLDDIEWYDSQAEATARYLSIKDRAMRIR